MSLVVPRGTQAVIPGGSREVMLDREQPIRIMKVTADGKGGVTMYAVVEPMRGPAGRGPARNLGAPLPPREHAPAIAASPEELARRGLGPDGQPIPAAAPEPPTNAPGGLLPGKSPGGGPMRAGGEAPAAPNVQHHAREAQAAQARIEADRARGQQPAKEDLRRVQIHQGAAAAPEAQQRRGSAPRTPGHLLDEANAAKKAAPPAPKPAAPAPRSAPEPAPQLKQLMSENRIGSVKIRSADGAIQQAQRDLDNGDDPHAVAQDLRHEAERMLDERPEPGMFGDGKTRNLQEMRAAQRLEAGRLRNLANKLDGHVDTRDNPSEPGFHGTAPEPPTNVVAKATPGPASGRRHALNAINENEVKGEYADNWRTIRDAVQSGDMSPDEARAAALDQAKVVRERANAEPGRRNEFDAVADQFRKLADDIGGKKTAEGRKPVSALRSAAKAHQPGRLGGGDVGVRRQAVLRHQEIARAMPMAEVDAEIRDLIAKNANNDVIAEHIRHIANGPSMEEIRDEARRTVLKGQLEDVARHFEAGRKDKGLAALGGLMARGNVKREGEIGKKVPFDPKIHKLADGVNANEGDMVEIQRPGAVLAHGPGDRTQLAKGLVGNPRTTPVKKVAKAAAPRVAKKALPGTKPTAERRPIPEDLNAVPAADVRKLAEEHGLKPRGADGKMRPVAELRKELHAKAGRPNAEQRKAAKKAAAPRVRDELDMLRAPQLRQHAEDHNVAIKDENGKLKPVADLRKELRDKGFTKVDLRTREPAKKAVRAPEPNAQLVRAKLLDLKTDKERRDYLDGLNLNKAQADRLAKALGARGNRDGGVGGVHDNIVKHFEGAHAESIPRTSELRAGMPSGAGGKGGSGPGKPLERMLVKDLEKVFTDENIARPKGRLLKNEMIALIQDHRAHRGIGGRGPNTREAADKLKRLRAANAGARPVKAAAVAKSINKTRDPWILRPVPAIRAEARMHGIPDRDANGKLVPIDKLKRDLNARGILPGQPAPLKPVAIPDDLEKLPAKDVRVIALPNGVPIHGADGKARPIADIRADLARVRDKNKPKPPIPHEWEMQRMIRAKKRQELVDLARIHGVDLKGVRGNRELIQRLDRKRIALHRQGPDFHQKSELDKMSDEQLRNLAEEDLGRPANGMARGDLIGRLEGVRKQPPVAIEPGAEGFKKMGLADLIAMADEEKVRYGWPPRKNEVINALFKAGHKPDGPIDQMDRAQIAKKLIKMGIHVPDNVSLDEARQMMREPGRVWFVPKVVANRGIAVRIMRARIMDQWVKKFGIKQDDRLGHGAMGDTRKLKLGNGEAIVLKRHRRVFGVGAKEQADGEQLAGVVLHHMPHVGGNNAPAVHRVDGTTVYVGWIDGKLGSNAGLREQDEAVASPAGKWMGVLDTVIGNADRHGENWMVRKKPGKAARPIPLDHGLAWEDVHEQRGFGVRRDANGVIQPPEESNGSPFALKWIRDRNGDWRNHIEISRSELETFRTSLEKERPQFALLGREDWFNVTMERLDQIIMRASLP
jgi:hypothetical protein